MSIITRMIKLCKADIHGVMDQIEDKGLLLKQLIRDMEEDLGKKEAELQKIIISRHHTVKNAEKHKRDMEKLELDIMSSIEKNKDEIGKILIKKKIQIELHHEAMQIHIESINLNIDQFKEVIKTRHLQCEKLKLRAAEYFQKQEQQKWEKNITHAVPRTSAAEPSAAEIELELIKRKEAVKRR